MKNFILFLVFIFVIIILAGCEKPNSDENPLPPFTPVSSVTSSLEILVGDTAEMVFSSNADSLVITMLSGQDAGMDPKEGTFAYVLSAEGTSDIQFDFYWFRFTTNHSIKNCYVTGYLPLETNALSTQIPWRTSATFHLETHFADSTVISYSVINSVLKGDYIGNFITDVLDTTTLVNISTYNKLGVTKECITINVAEPTNGDYVCKCGPWKRIRDQHSLDINLPGEDIDISAPCFQDDRRIFNEDGTSVLDYGENLCDGQTNRFYYRDWFISANGSILYLGINPQYLEYILISIDQNTMVWKYESIYILEDGISWVPMWVTETLVHP